MALFTTAAATHVAEISSEGPVRAVFGLSNEILECAKAVRVNSVHAEALARRVQQTMTVLSAILEEHAPGLDASLNYFVERLQSSLAKTLSDIQAIMRQKYLSQLLHREVDKEKLQNASTAVKAAVDALMVDLRLRTTVRAAELAAQFENLVPCQTFQLQGISSGIGNVASRLPPQPYLHFGREEELLAAVTAVTAHNSGHVAILGGPGMGKTTLATAVLHHSTVIARFGARRFFVRCDSVDGQTNCLSVIAATFGIVATESVVAQKLLLATLRGLPTLLVLDNFESAWESNDQRRPAEQLLQLLGSVDNLSLIVTLRGTELPDGIKWSRPFLPPLPALSDAAASHTFMAIADVADSNTSLHNLLHHMDNIPLAVVLRANLAQSEHLETLLRRWEELETAMLHRGGKPDRTNSLDMSIELSLRSPRMRASPGASRLLSLLSLLPNGVSDIDIRHWDIESSAQSLSVLIKTSLAVLNGDNRIYVLAPVRSFILARSPPSEDEAVPIYDHYFDLAERIIPAHTHDMDLDVLALVASEMANIDAIVRFALMHSQRALARAIQAVASLCVFRVATGLGSGPELLPLAISAARDAGLRDLHANLLMKWARMSSLFSVPGDPYHLARCALEIYQQTGNAAGALEAGIYLIVSHPQKTAMSEARRLFTVAEAADDCNSMARCVQELGVLYSDEGHYSEAAASHQLAITLGIKSGNMRLAGNSRFLLAKSFQCMGKLEDAIEMYGAALRTHEAVGNVNGTVRTHLQLAETYITQGSLKAAVRHAEEALSVKGTEGLFYYPDNLMVLAGAHALAGDFCSARSAIDRVYQLEFSHNLSRVSHCRLMYTKALVSHLSGDMTEARMLLSVARTIAREEHGAGSPKEHPANMKYIEASLIEALSEVEASDGHPEKALTTAVTAAAHFRTAAPSTDGVDSLVLLADVVEDAIAEPLIAAVLLPLLRAGHAHRLAKALVRSARIARGRGQCELARHRAGYALEHLGEIQDERFIRAARSLM